MSRCGLRAACALHAAPAVYRYRCAETQAKTQARYSGDGAARRPATPATTVCSPVLCELTIYMTAIAYTVNTYSRI